MDRLRIRFWGFLLLVSVLQGNLFADNSLDSLTLELEQFHSESERIGLLNELSDLLGRSDYKQSIKYAQEALELSSKTKNNAGRADALNSLGRNYRLQGVYQLSLDYFMQAHQAFKSISDKSGMAISLNNIAVVYLSLDKNDQALKYFHDAQIVFEELQDNYRVAIVLLNIGAIFSDMSEYRKALSYYERSLILVQSLEEGKRNRLEAYLNNNIGNVYKNENTPNLALPYFENSLTLKRKQGDLPGMANSILNIANSYLLLGETERAKDSLDKAIFMAKEGGFLSILLECYGIESDLYMEINDYEQAFLTLKMYVRINDSATKASQQSQLTEMQSLFEYERQEAEIGLLKEKEGAQSVLMWVLLLGVIILLAFLLVLLRFYRSNIVANRLLVEQKDEIASQKDKIEIRNLALEDLERERKGLINIVAHDLKSPLNRSEGLLGLIKNDPLTESQLQFVELIEKVNRQGSDLIRDLLMLNSADPEFMVATPKRLNLQKISQCLLDGFQPLGDKKRINIHLVAPSQPVFVLSDETILVRILENLLSNALKFSHSDTTVKLRIYSDSKSACISISDQGPGISAKDQAKMFQMFQRLSARPTGGEGSTGLGLAIVKKLALSLGAKLSVESELGKGTKFIVEISNEKDL